VLTTEKDAHEDRKTSSRVGALLLAVALAGAALVIFLMPFEITGSSSRVPLLAQEISLMHHQPLKVGIVPGCPPAMPELACWDNEHRFARAFEVVYWSAGKNVTLVSIRLSRR
jgi:hypothetical protein